MKFSSDIIIENCELNFLFNMTPKAPILDAGDTLLLSNLDKPHYLHCIKHNNIPISIPVYEYTAVNRSLSCDCHLQGGNKFLHKSLAFCPYADKINRNINFTINVAFTYQLQMILPEAKHSEELTG